MLGASLQLKTNIISSRIVVVVVVFLCCLDRSRANWRRLTFQRAGAVQTRLQAMCLYSNSLTNIWLVDSTCMRNQPLPSCMPSGSPCSMSAPTTLCIHSRRVYIAIYIYIYKRDSSVPSSALRSSGQTLRANSAGHFRPTLQFSKARKQQVRAAAAAGCRAASTRVLSNASSLRCS